MIATSLPYEKPGTPSSEPYRPAMAVWPDDITLKCWADDDSTTGNQLYGCNRLGPYALGLCERHALELLGQPATKKVGNATR